MVPERGHFFAHVIVSDSARMFPWHGTLVEWAEWPDREQPRSALLVASASQLWVMKRGSYWICCPMNTGIWV
jgi:hypothetical protein